MIAVKAVDDAKTGQMKAVRRRSLAWVSISLAILVAATSGYFLLQWRLDQPNRELVRDLPVIERVDEYRDADSLEFLEQLHKEGLFAAEVDDGT
jgi:hypothetical protein